MTDFDPRNNTTFSHNDTTCGDCRHTIEEEGTINGQPMIKLLCWFSPPQPHTDDDDWRIVSRDRPACGKFEEEEEEEEEEGENENV